MSTFADWIVAHRELDAEPHTRALRAALTPLNEQNHLPVVHATLGEMWAAEAETKATKFLISRPVLDAAWMLKQRPDDTYVVFELALNWIVNHGWIEYAEGIEKLGIHFYNERNADIYLLTDRFIFCGKIVIGNSFHECHVVPSKQIEPHFEEQDIKNAIAFYLMECLCIQAFLACPGATTIRRSFHSEKLQRARRKRTGFGFCSHNIVEFPRTIASKSTSDTVAHLTGMMRRHLVRGHLTWRGTPRERWQPAYWRGNAARGVIHKDYYLGELAMVGR